MKDPKLLLVRTKISFQVTILATPGYHSSVCTRYVITSNETGAVWLDINVVEMGIDTVFTV